MPTGRTGDLRIARFGERALLVQVDDQPRIHSLAAALLADLSAGRLEDLVPGDRSLLVRFDGTDGAERAARRALASADASLHRSPEATATPPRRRVIPVHYGGTDGPDLDDTSAIVGRSAREVIDLHAGRDYSVLFLGFAPGFAYMGDLAPEIVAPRVASPRTSTPRGSVAIAEGYTGVYPADLPGGWRVIGRTPVLLFDPAADPPTYLLPGDTVRFEPAGSADRGRAPYRPADWER